jgi:type VI protein secretion system component VasK
MIWSLGFLAAMLRNPFGRWVALAGLASVAVALIWLSVCKMGANSERIQQQSKNLDALRDFIANRENTRDLTREELLQEARKWAR